MRQNEKIIPIHDPGSARNWKPVIESLQQAGLHPQQLANVIAGLAMQSALRMLKERGANKTAEYRMLDDAYYTWGELINSLHSKP